MSMAGNSWYVFFSFLAFPSLVDSTGLKT